MVSPKIAYRGRIIATKRQLQIALFAGFGVLAILLVLGVGGFHRSRQLSTLGEKQRIKLFIAIGSKPSNTDLRGSARRSWLQWSEEDQVEYRFFSDAPKYAQGDDVHYSKLLKSEAQKENDIVLMDIAGGYGTKEDNTFLARALYQFKYAVENYEFDYFLRIDDDSFLCLHRLLFEISSYPKEQFFMGRFWCKSGRHRADENFMLFSSDLTAFFANRPPIIPMDESVTFAWNFGILAYLLNITVFDDQTRIDAQQGYLTDFMHENHTNSAQRHMYGSFCEKHIYAHHVKYGGVMEEVFRNTRVHILYDAPSMTSQWEACKADDRSFIPARHSKLLPNVIVQDNDAASQG